MLVGRNRYESVSGGRMFDVCATTGEYTGTASLASHSGTQWDGVGIDHNAVLSVLNHYEDEDTVDVTVKLCPELRDRLKLSDDLGVNVPTCARTPNPNRYFVFDGPLNLPIRQDEDGILHIQVPKTLYEQGFLLNKASRGSGLGLVVPKTSRYKCSAVTRKCCYAEDFYTPTQPYLPIVPGQTEYEICN